MISLKEIAAVALAVLVVLPSQALAACDRSDRIRARDATCLDASWHNPRGLEAVFGRSSFEVQNLCPELGKVVAKVDIVMDMDRTFHLTTGERREFETVRLVRGIHCCSDLSDLCSR